MKDRLKQSNLQHEQRGHFGYESIVCEEISCISKALIKQCESSLCSNYLISTPTNPFHFFFCLSFPWRKLIRYLSLSGFREVCHGQIPSQNVLGMFCLDPIPGEEWFMLFISQQSNVQSKSMPQKASWVQVPGNRPSRYTLGVNPHISF